MIFAFVPIHFLVREDVFVALTLYVSHILECTVAGVALEGVVPIILRDPLALIYLHDPSNLLKLLLKPKRLHVFVLELVRFSFAGIVEFSTRTLI